MRLRIPLRLRIKLSLQGLGLVLRRPRYIFLAAIAGVMFYELIFWFNNWPMLGYVLSVPTLSGWSKLQFIASTYTNLWQSTASPLAVSLIALSVVQGIIISGLIFTIRRQRAANRNAAGILGATGIASVLATLGLGCAACGTSLITPVLLWLFSTSSVALADSVGLAVTFLGLAASIYGAYAVGLRANTAASQPVQS